MAQMLKNLPAVWEAWVQSLGQEDLLKKGMAIHSSILAQKVSWAKELSFNTLEIVQAISARPLDITKEYCYPEHLFNFICTFESRVESLA